MNRAIPLSILTLVLAGGLACGRKAAPGAPPAEKAAEHPPQEAPLEVALQEIRGIRFAPAPPPRPEGAWYPAEAIGDESAQSLITSPVKGIVTAIRVPPGSRAAKGTPLLVLQSPELARLKADWIAARARCVRSGSELAREERLAAAGAGSRRELEAAQSEAAIARADQEAARLALEARGVPPEAAGATLPVRAPGAGTVTAYRIQPGQGVEAGQELGAFQSAAAAIVRLELPLPAPQNWQPGAITEVRKADGQRWQARLEGIPATLTPDTRRLSYRLRLQGSPLPLPGTPLEVRVPLATAVVLPQAALQQIEGTWGVFLRSGDRAAFHPVRRGTELGGDVMVLEGVRPGDTVAVEGAYLLKSMILKRKSGGEDHDH